jgi:hypothetical protein
VANLMVQSPLFQARLGVLHNDKGLRHHCALVIGNPAHVYLGAGHQYRHIS